MATRSAPGALAAFAWFLASAPAVAAPAAEPIASEAEPLVVSPHGDLRPGRSTALYVADVAPTAEEPPGVEVSAGTIRYEGAVAPGIWAFELVPPIEGDAVDVAVTTGAGTTSRSLPIRVPRSSELVLPDRIEGSARGGEIVFRVTGPDLPPPDGLQVVAGEGRIGEVRAVDGGLEVTLVPEDTPFPRAIPVGVRDRRSDARPTWGIVRLRARPSIPLHTEPGSSVVLTVGGRTYGPFQADATGLVTAVVDQYPGDLVARAVVTDDLGNETSTDLPLAASTQPVLVPFPTDEITPGESPPLVWLHALGLDGSRWTGPPPTCRTPAVDLPVREVARGHWLVSLPALAADGPTDLRVACNLGANAATSFRVPAVEGVPARLRMRLWPTDLRAELPTAEVRVVLEDTRGERLPIDGVEIRAEHGEVVANAGEDVALAEYDGAAAVARGGDVVTAVYAARTPGTFVEQLRLAWGDIGAQGPLVVHGRALDPRRRPVPGVPIAFDAGGEPVTAITGSDGWATAEVPRPADAAPWILRIRHRDREHRLPVVVGQASPGGPGSPDLVDSQEVTIRPGRVAGISVGVEPSILRAGPGSTAWIRVSVEDRAGGAITDEQVRIEVSDGVVGALRARSDGSFLAEYTPSAVESPREVVVTARTDLLRSSTTLTVEPRLVRLSLGPWIGAQTNFGAVTAPVAGLDADLRVRNRLLGEAAMFRLGVATYTFTSEADAKLASPAAIRSTVVPLSASFLVRKDVGPFGLFAGAGAALAVHAMELRLGDDLVGRGSKLLGGPVVSVGVSRRALGGELNATLRSTWLPSSGGEFGFSGNVGGLAGGLGYRVVF